MRVTLAFSPAPRQVVEHQLDLPPDATVRDALAAQGVREALAALGPGFDPASAALGIWGRAAGADDALRDNDRVEIYRDLRVDPKVARRERYSAQGAGTPGLFAKKRTGAKAGY